MTGPAGRPPARSPELARLALIRVAMLAGVLTFGAVVWFLRRGGRTPPVADATDRLRLVGIVVGAIALAGILVARTLAARADDRRRLTYSVMGWALGEAAALYGGFYYYATGNLAGYMLGLMILLVSFVFIPVVPSRR